MFNPSISTVFFLLFLDDHRKYEVGFTSTFIYRLNLEETEPKFRKRKKI